MNLPLLPQSLIKIAAASALLLSAAAQAGPMFSNAYVFGDSLSDTGNIRNILGDGLGNLIGYGDNGRFSNGPVWHEYLTLNDDLFTQDDLGISRTGGTNYAYGGARIEPVDGPVGAVVQSAATQVADYLDGGTAVDPNALYISWIGGNDVRSLVGDSDPWDEVNAALDALQGMLADLLAAGATNLFVPNLPDIGSIPEFASNEADSLSAHDITVAWNDGLKNRLLGLNESYVLANIIYFDVFDLYEQLIADPAAFGYTDVTSQCRSLVLGAESACANADTTLFWDSIHPTTAAHQRLADSAYDTLVRRSAIPLPSSLLLLLCGLATIGYARFSVAGGRR